MHFKTRFETESLDIIYEINHIQRVLTEIEKGFSVYAGRFCGTKNVLAQKFTAEIDEFLGEQPKYEIFLDLAMLEEYYDDDPNAFKPYLGRACPIVQRCLWSPEEAMKKYKAAFWEADSEYLLGVTLNITRFGQVYQAGFDEESYERLDTVEALGLSDLLEDDYIAYGVIGTGIKSHFLYMLSPYAFPNRSQDAVWALYFLSNKKDFGLLDDSEFLMIDTKKFITQQNYLYPYDLFTFYALHIYRMLKKACEDKGYYFDSLYRYVYVNAFLKFVADEHRDFISLVKDNGEHDYFS